MTMTELDRYLENHYLTEESFAARSGIELDELHDLVRRGLVPGPSYIVRDGSLHSFVFGALPAPGSTPGSYFHPAMVDWVVKARHDLAAHGVDGAADRAHRSFAEAFAAALQECNLSVFRLSDAFDDQGDVISAGLNARVESAWEHFLGGTFGLCVANPRSAREIARKEVLQERLTSMTDNGSREHFSPEDLPALRQLVDEYVASSMPFSPIEYARSSRKRLVDDVRPRLEEPNVAT